MNSLIESNKQTNKHIGKDDRLRVELVTALEGTLPPQKKSDFSAARPSRPPKKRKRNHAVRGTVPRHFSWTVQLKVVRHVKGVGGAYWSREQIGTRASREFRVFIAGIKRSVSLAGT
jgi:hypothetical protein